MWDIDRAVTALSRKIKESDFNPDIVVSVGNGASTVAELLVRRLGLISLISLYRRYDWRIEDWGYREPDLPENLDVAGLRVLLVIGILDTEETADRAFHFISSKGPRAVKTASVFKVESTDFLPDYYVYRIKSREEVPLWR